MNAPLPALSADTLASLRQQARATGQTVMQRVQEQFGLDADATLHLLAAHSHQPAFDMAALNALTVDFSQLSFNEAARRHCLVARDADAQLWLLLADPWDSASRAYAAHVLGVPFKTGLAASGRPGRPAGAPRRRPARDGRRAAAACRWHRIPGAEALVVRQHRRGCQPGGAAGALDPVRRAESRRVGHPSGNRCRAG